ncbi:MAG: amidohydrolase family protein [Bacteroidetes bacterium]|nr:amidohydrolase family protein [Bacteroidota bacterium]
MLIITKSNLLKQKKRIKNLFFFGFVFSQLLIKAQVTFPINGAPSENHTIFAFTNAVIYLDYETILKNGILVIQNGKVLICAEKATIPEGATIIDLKGKYIYPSFIDLYSDYGMPVEVKPQIKLHLGPQITTNIKGAYGWNEAIKADVDAYKIFSHNTIKADEYKKIGFGAVLTHSIDGIVRGSGALVLLNSNKKENESVIAEKCAAFYSFNKGASKQDYPSSLTGAIALLRQTYYDAQWYANGGYNSEFNISLDAFNKLQALPKIFDAGDKFNAYRAANVAKEFKQSFIIKGSGNEYQRINDMADLNSKFILPVNFPEGFDIDDPYDADAIPLTDLKHWELAPTNLTYFQNFNIPFAITCAELKDKTKFLPNIRKAMQFGLTEKMVLKALTFYPAQFINANLMGTLKTGNFANFFISNKNIFDDDAQIIQHWIKGQANTYSDINFPDWRGKYEFITDSKNYIVTFSGDVNKPSAKIKIDTTSKNINYTFANNVLTFSFQLDSTKLIRASANYDSKTKQFDGTLQNNDGYWNKFTLKFISKTDSTIKPKPKVSDIKVGKIIYPFNAYGEPLSDEQSAFKEAWKKFKNRYSAILIKNATIWTNEQDSILKESDVYIVEGKIVRIAPNIDAPKLAFAKVIDAKDMHLTPGIIDEHSHIALTHGVNEGTQASSAEVRMGDVINPDDINIYRQLSGGVTCSQILHGSANPIGGQSILIKLRWGQNAEGLKYENADPFIKFALGENVKQSNWGDFNTTRFPQSRMGVEQVFIDYFTRAKEYNAEKIRYESSKAKNKMPFRKNIELDAIAEILNNKRFITCHSYVQSELNMLMHVADSFKIKINTFTHVLEGYKVADKIKAHGANASTFSDWWAYKNEVMDAIPYNASILTKMGINTAINSDDAEMGRRLNQEAGKIVKYGKLSEIQALKLVTINPAKMLHIDNKVGSIKVGKVADLVLWTDNPLSEYAKVDKTIIDGEIYFDRENDLKLQQYIASEKARIISKLVVEKQKGIKMQKYQPKQQRLYHCNTLEGVSEQETGER